MEIKITHLHFKVEEELIVVDVAAQSHGWLSAGKVADRATVNFNLDLHKGLDKPALIVLGTVTLMALVDPSKGTVMVELPHSTIDVPLNYRDRVNLEDVSYQLTYTAAGGARQSRTQEKRDRRKTPWFQPAFPRLPGGVA